MTDLNIYLARASEILAWLFLVISFWKNKDNKLLFLQLIANIFFLLDYVFLGATSGLFVILFEMIRDIFYIKRDDDIKIFWLSFPIYIIIGVFSYEGIMSLFSIIASINDGYSLVYHGKKVVFLGILTYILWLIYDYSIGSYVNVLAESIIIVSNIFILIAQKDTKKMILRR